MKNSETFLALTCDSRFWNTDGNVLFLGDWCLEEVSDPSVLSFPFAVLPSPWNSQRDIDKVAVYLDEFGETILACLGDKLNEHHGLNYDLRSWRVLAGNWILHAVHSIYDRFLLLRQAVDSCPDLWTQIPSLDTNPFRTTNSFKEAQLYPDTSLLLFALLVREMGIHHEVVKGPLIQGEHSMYSNGPQKQVFRQALRKLFRKYQYSVARHSASPVLFIGTGLRNKTVKKFGAVALEVDKLEIPVVAQYDLKNRNRLFSGVCGSDGFQKIAIAILPRLLPSSLLEEFALWKNHAAVHSIGGSAPTVVTYYGFMGDEDHAHLLVRLARSGCRLVGMQHGGGYGSFRYCPEELHESRCSDAFVTWGWAEDSCQYPLPSLHLLNVRKTVENARVHGQDRSGLLLVTTARPRLTHRIQSHPLTGQMARYYAWQERFYDSLDRHARDQFIVKPLALTAQPIPKTIWWERRGISTEQGSLIQMMRHFRLLVFDHNGTGFLEALCANVPSLVFWDTCLWELRDSVASIFEGLEQVGIFHRTPESAGERANQVFANPDAWWRGDDLQSARAEFCQRLARTGEDWQEEWREFLNVKTA